jgi:hypothetical protein
MNMCKDQYKCIKNNENEEIEYYYDNFFQKAYMLLITYNSTVIWED